MENFIDAGTSTASYEPAEQVTEVNGMEEVAALAGTDDIQVESPSYLTVDDYANHLVTVKVDGEELEVPLSEALGGYMRQAAFTRKTQRLSEEARQHADALAVYQALQADPEGFLASLSGALGDTQVNSSSNDDDEFLDPTEREVRELKAKLNQLEQFEQRRIFDAEVGKLVDKYGPEVDVAEVVNHFAANGFPTLEAAYKDLVYDLERERLKELESKMKRDQAARTAARNSSVVSSGTSRRDGAVGTDTTQVKGIRAQYELAKQQLGLA
jgi:hypothetical protein